MLQRRYSDLFIAFLLMIFAAQFVANATMTCKLKPEVLTLSINHASHDFHEMSVRELAAGEQKKNIGAYDSADCCKTMGHFLSGGCSWGSCLAAAVHRNAHFTLPKQLLVNEDFYSRDTPAPLAPFHYRPPIFS